MEAVGIDTLQVVPPVVIIAVTGRHVKMGGIDAVFLHGADHLRLVVFGDRFNALKLSANFAQNLFAEIQYGRGDPQLCVYIM